MSKEIGLVANLELCMGCFACEVACKQEHNLPEGKKGIKVVTLGPYEVNGELVMNFVPLATDECDLCVGRTAAGDRPFCVQVCPTQALGLHSPEEILPLLRSNERFNICKMDKSVTFKS